MKYRLALDPKFFGKYFDSNEKAYIIFDDKDERIAEDLTRSEAEKEILSLNDIAAKQGKCFLVEVTTGCTCCSDDNFFEGPYFTKAFAEERAALHKTRKTLSSQYADSGHQHIREVTYEIVGTYVILNEWYAKRIPEHLHHPLNTGEMTNEELDIAFNTDRLDDFSPYHS